MALMEMMSDVGVSRAGDWAPEPCSCFVLFLVFLSHFSSIERDARADFGDRGERPLGGHFREGPQLSMVASHNHASQIVGGVFILFSFHDIWSWNRGTFGLPKRFSCSKGGLGGSVHCISESIT